ncbi:MAG: dTDP-4-dehydrorhamnose 3,5-epimerase family protein [Bacteroidales bacterium]|nr:dTDP-4-dehydrorhamnose 3,5-epimerase family protein [Bacteroidales bacterium]MCF8405341.1 dTDP-4-dehydrorhamnose 3,5-epimerase family protein [Bacteroidales bacterium]
MTFKQTILEGAWVVTLDPFVDDRGTFSRMFCENEFAEIGFTKNFAQVNYATNKSKGIFRGLHFQVPPYSDSKLIRCVRGKVYDVIVDIRQGSKTFLKSFAIELSPEENKMLFITDGFAHGYLTLEVKCELIYFHSTAYKPGFEGGLNYKDPKLNIALPFEPSKISEKDKNYTYIDNKFNGIKI